MAIPRVFISSTCYDLKYVRENLKYFIKNMGYEPILSENGDIYYDTCKHTHDACITEVGNCQIFVLIIGGRFGGEFKNSEKSITNKEYDEAISRGIPVFTLIEHSVYCEHNVYNKNEKNKKINYPSVDNIAIFEFIDQVRKNNKNNAIQSFNDFGDIENYLKKQWAGMLFSYLTNQTTSEQVQGVLSSIDAATQKIEYFTRQIVDNTNNNITKLKIKLYDLIINAEVSHTLRAWKINISPRKILKNETLDNICNNEIIAEENTNYSLRYGGPPYRLSRKTYEKEVINYTTLRNELISLIKEKGFEINTFLEDEEN